MRADFSYSGVNYPVPVTPDTLDEKTRILVRQMEHKLWLMDRQAVAVAKQHTLMFQRIQELELITAHQRNTIGALQSEVFAVENRVTDRVKFAVVEALYEHGQKRSLNLIQSIWQRLRR